MFHKHSALFSLALTATLAAAPNPPDGDLMLCYDEPATVWEEALPVGNGRLGAMVYGGSSPQALSNNPVSHRTDVLEELDGLQALGGTFRAHEALAAATLVLAEGINTNKKKAAASATPATTITRNP